MTMGNDNTPTRSEEVEINLGEYFAILRKNGWKIVLFSLVVGLVTLLVMFLFPNIYQATAVIAPPVQDKRENPAFGMLATFGVNVGGATKVEDLESLFKSNDLTVRVFGKHNLWPILYKDRYDPATGKIRKSWTSRLFGGKEPTPPGDWDAIRAARTRLKVLVNRRAGTLSVSFESSSPSGSADIVKYYLDEGKNRLQEEALLVAEGRIEAGGIDAHGRREVAQGGGLEPLSPEDLHRRLEGRCPVETARPAPRPARVRHLAGAFHAARCAFCGDFHSARY